jgi:hypothetical protein
VIQIRVDIRAPALTSEEILLRAGADTGFAGGLQRADIAALTTMNWIVENIDASPVAHFVSPWALADTAVAVRPHRTDVAAPSTGHLGAA